MGVSHGTAQQGIKSIAASTLPGVELAGGAAM